MLVRGAPLIGATAAYGMALALRDDPSDAALDGAYATLLATRPTASICAGRSTDAAAVRNLPPRASAPPRPIAAAAAICDEDVAIMPRDRRARCWR